ncbi:hypothetical protein HYH03_017758 [Edaphochlamys debaryana]|uniref:protein-tyrosine-phosphatase n=1 Tax=Edaphochlamys debaryana TaxID=47281 RepID=A0A836BQ88_9CHLO|nr:hypothetical protein HYH03_017758 [Edaphochlamys debaryana]|eukprot:KAG2483358.1 hypothetical protein HYH03_017758 [Edaphochlamys debaryana]
MHVSGAEAGAAAWPHVPAALPNLECRGERGGAVHGSCAFLEVAGTVSVPATAHAQPQAQNHAWPACPTARSPSSGHHPASAPDLVSYAEHHVHGGLGLFGPGHHPSQGTYAWAQHHHGQHSHHHSQQQFAWRSYHGHGAGTGPSSESKGDGPSPRTWDGWTEFSGSRPVEQAPGEAPGRPPPAPGSAPAPTAGHAPGPAGPSPGPANGPSAAAAIGAVGGVGDDLYDPLADVDMADGAGPTAAAAASAPGPAAAVGPVLSPVDLVVVWDLDETLIVFNSLLNGTFARAAAAGLESSTRPAAAGPTGPGPAAPSAGPGPGSTPSVPQDPGAGPAAQQAAGEQGNASLPARASALGARLAGLVFDFVDNHLDFRLLDSMDPLSFGELWALAAAPEEAAEAGGAFLSAAGPMPSPHAVPHRQAFPAPAVPRETVERIARVFGGGGEGLLGALGPAQSAELAAALAEAEALSGGWVAAARRLLAAVTAAVAAEAVAAERGLPPPPPPHAALAGGPPFRTVRHVLVSAGHLVATLGKLLLWGLDGAFDIRDVYSASGRSKLDAFRALRLRFGPAAAFVSVGDGAEEDRAAGMLGWGHVRVGLGVGLAGGARSSGGEGAGGGGAGSTLSRTDSEGGCRPWSVPRPLGEIAAAEVLAAAREAY